MCLEDSEVDTICLTYYLIYNKIGISFSIGFIKHKKYCVNVSINFYYLAW